MDKARQLFRLAFAQVTNDKNRDKAEQNYARLAQLLTTRAVEFENLPGNEATGYLNKLITDKLRKPDTHFIPFLNDLIRVAYSTLPPLRSIIYQVIPDLLIQLQKYQFNEESEEVAPLRGIDQTVLNIYNIECQTASRHQQNNQLNIDSYLQDLLRNNQAVSFLSTNYQPLGQLNFSNKVGVKTFMMFLYHLHVRERSEQSVISFFHLVYVYCGGKVNFDDFGLYLLNKSNQKTIFVHRVCEQQMQWILLVLYYIHVNYKHLKFEVIAATGMLRRKSGNECKFRICEIAQSMLHLFENQYEGVF